MEWRRFLLNSSPVGLWDLYPGRQLVTHQLGQLLILLEPARRSGPPNPHQYLDQEDCYQRNLAPLSRRTRKQPSHTLNRILTPTHLRGRSRQWIGTQKVVH